jgi:DNA-binding NarL/FixJ family response regulator
VPNAVPDASAISVLVADDQQLIRAGFRVILENQPGIVVVAEAANGRDAVKLAQEREPAVVLMDIRMPVMDGLEAARQILATCSSRVVVLTTFDTDEYVYEALRLGASGFLLKDSPPEQLVAAVRAVAAGDAMLDPTITRRLIGAFANAGPPPSEISPQLATLTPRELDVFRLIARGQSNLEIARELVVEESTIKTHVAHVLFKLGLRDRVQAVIFAYETGLAGGGPRG